MSTAKYGLKSLAVGQSNAHLSVNENSETLDAFTQLAIEDRDLAAPPGSPTIGHVYIVAASPTGGWSTFAENDLVRYASDSTWQKLTPVEGVTGWVKDEDLVVHFDGTNWFAPGSYSTSEHYTGTVWVDGKKIYRKVVDMGAMPNNTTKSVAHGLTAANISEIVSLTLMASNGPAGSVDAFPVPNNGLATSIGLYMGLTNVNVVTNSDQSAYSGQAILEYTKV